MTNNQLLAAWKRKLPNVEPTDQELTAFAIGVEVGQVELATQVALVEKCIVAMNENADRGEKCGEPLYLAAPVAQPVQEPYGYLVHDPRFQSQDFVEGELDGDYEGQKILPLYAAPVAQPAPDPQLCKFYGVETYPALVEAQARHIEKLQAKLPNTTGVFMTQKVREG